MAKKSFTLKFDLVTVITVVIVIAWAAAYVAEFLSPTFEAPSSLDPLMLLVASTYITKSAVETQQKAKKDEPEVEPESEKEGVE